MTAASNRRTWSVQVPVEQGMNLVLGASQGRMTVVLGKKGLTLVAQIRVSGLSLCRCRQYRRGHCG